MNHERNEPEAVLDRVLAEIRDEAVDPSAVSRAGERVWSRLSRDMASPASGPDPVDRIRSCADIETLIPSYLEGSLAEARALLVADHTRECVPCRRALREARSGGARPLRSAPAPSTRESRSPALHWGIAASVVLAAGLAGFAAFQSLRMDPSLSVAHVQTIEGALYRVSGNRAASAIPGEEVPGGEVFRTARGSRAVVRLVDGSQVEMNERSEMSVSARRARTTLRLTRGSIIVEAAKQGSRRLYVDTSDCRVAVTGTIFSVNHGTKGSRVSVIEGEVRVRHSGSESVLHPGDQLSTNPRLERIPMSNEISWSQNVDSHLAVFEALTRLRKDLDALPHPQLRHATRLLDLVPDGTVFYAAIPNLGGTLGDAHRVLQEHLQGSPVLRQWWEETMAPAGGSARIEEVVQKIRAFGDHLKDEIVLGVEMGENGSFEGVLLLAQLTDPSAFRPFLEEEAQKLNASISTSTSHGPAVRILDDLGSVTGDRRGAPDELLLWVHDDLLAASSSVAQLRRLESVLEGKEASRFVTSSFHGTLAQAYQEGTAWLLGVNLERILEKDVHPADARGAAAMERTGFLDAQHLIVEGKEVDGATQYRAVLAFDQPRRGVASWLAEPGPMGTLEFISPDATVAAAFVAKSPAFLTRDLFELLEAEDPDLLRKLHDFESRHDVNVLEDFAAPLGGEFAFALDGPVLPKPAWKVVVEVYDPTRLERTIEWAVTELNRLDETGAEPILHLEQEQVGDRTYFTLRSPRFPVEVHYTFVDGYLVAAPARSLIEAAIGQRQAGATLSASSRFLALLPRDGNANLSAVAYQNLGPVLGPLTRTLGSPDEPSLTPGQRKAMETILEEAPPSLAYAYGEEDRIVIATTRPGGMLGPHLDALMGLHGILELQKSVGQATGDGASEAPAR